ncbi:MAG: glycosyltransferase [Clostridia bacterium]|nr:glycosyltransferase [Clostridia bacterium]MBQ5900944.1 glycosyltransferase [Clostridia bacterium]
MKILMVNKFLYSRGGCENYMLYLAEHLKNMGHEVEFFGMYDEKNTVGNSANLYTANMDFHTKGLKRFLYPFKIIYSFEAKRKIMKVIDRFKPDIVHMNNINFQLTPSIIYGIKKKGVPVVQTVHDYQMICPNHLLYNFDENKICEKCLKGSYGACIKNRCIHNSRIKSIIGAIEARLYSVLKTYEKVDLYISPSYFLEKKLLSAKALYKGKTKTIHNFIDKQKFTCENSGSGEYIAFAGRLSKEKGVELLAQTAKLLPQYKFMIAGDGPEKSLLEGIENVELVGFLGGKELIDFISNAKLLVVPSIWYENCPLSILEAQCMGVPVVTMNNGGMAELIKDGVTGVLVDEVSSDAMAQSLKRALESEGYCDMLKSNCKNEKENILSVDTYCDILIKEYEKLLAR